MQWPVIGPFLRDQLLQLPGTRKASAMDKRQAAGDVWLGLDGLQGDRVADRRYHGGPDRALCHYPAEHYPRWRGLYPHLRQIGPASFGENLSTEGLDERQVCIGDRFRWGEALIEVSQPRSPCGNLDRRHDAPGLSRQLARSGRTGWLYRTLEAGVITPGAALRLIERPYPSANIRRVWQSVIDQAACDDELSWLAELPPLAAEYRVRFRQRLDTRRRQQDQGALF